MSHAPLGQFQRNFTNMNSPGIRINKLGGEGFLKPTFPSQVSSQPYSPYNNPLPQNPPPPQNQNLLASPFTNSYGGVNQQNLNRFRDLGSPGKIENGNNRNGNDHSQPRRLQTNHNQQESTDGRHITSTDSRNPLLVSFGETSREHNFNRSVIQGRNLEVGAEPKLYSSPMQSGLSRNPGDSGINSGGIGYGNEASQDTVYGVRGQAYGYPNLPRTGNLQSKGFSQNQGREELELLRSKNKAYASVTREMFPEFLSKIEKMSQTVHKNINHSFSSKLKDIWVSYINDQNGKHQNSGKSINSYLMDLKPIEAASVDALNSQTDNLIKKIKLNQLEEIKKHLINPKGTEPELDKNHPLYQLECDYRFSRDKLDQVKKQLEDVKEQEDKMFYEMRRKHHHSVNEVNESSRRELKVKISGDPLAAENKLLQAREFYSTQLSSMKSDLKEGPYKFEPNFEQSKRIQDLEAKISALKNRLNMY